MSISRSQLWGIILLASALRLVALYYTGSVEFGDALLYTKEAKNLLAGKGIEHYAVMPLYPLLQALSGANPLFIRLVDVTLSVGTCWVIMQITYFLTEDRVATLLSGILAALLPASIAYSGFGMTETLFVFLVFTGMMLLHQERVFWASVFFVLSILTRPVMDLLAPVLIVWAIVIVHQRNLQSVLRGLGVYLLVYMVLMSPWWFHQYDKYDTFVRLNLGFGKVLYSGNNPKNDSGGGIRGVDVDFSGFEGIGTIEWDKNLAEAGTSYIRENPGRFVEMMGVKLARFWRFWPYAPQFRDNVLAIGTAMSTLPLLLLALMGIAVLASKRRPIAGLLLFSGYLMAIHVVTIASIRYRFPVEHVLIIFAGPGIVWLLGRVGWAGSKTNETG